MGFDRLQYVNSSHPQSDGESHGSKVDSRTVSARHAIRPTTTQFTSSLEFSDPKRIYRVYDPTAPVYVGNASAEIDQNWDDLILRTCVTRGNTQLYNTEY